MKLVIAEKPSVAMALASVIGARTRKDGYVEGKLRVLKNHREGCYDETDED